MNLFKLLKIIWSSPITLIGLIYAISFSLMKWYKFCGIQNNALIWKWDFKNQTMPKFLNTMWRNISTQVFGNVIISKVNPKNKLITSAIQLAHNQVNQHMTWGLFICFKILFIKSNVITFVRSLRS